MNSAIYRGVVVHRRLTPREHRFSYPHTFFAFDCAELDNLSATCPWFHHNRRGILSLRDRDYLDGRDEPVERQIERYLGAADPGDRLLLVTSPRYLGYAFNPVNFHLRLRGDALVAAVAEVNNTFKDRHVYPLTELREAGNGTWTAEAAKHFHVSPFNDMEGSYRFTLSVRPGALHLAVDLYRDGACVMETYIAGKARPLTNRSVLRHALLHPLDTAANSMPRILWQAAKLHYGKKLEVFRRPVPTHPMTIKRREDPR